MQGLLKLRREHSALRTGEQKHVVVTDDYYVFTRETTGEPVMVVFYKGDAGKSIAVDLADTTIANAKGFVPLNSGPDVHLQGSRIELQLAPQSVAVYEVE